MPLPPTTQIDPIKIFYPNGGNEAVQMYIWDGAKPILWDGSVSFSGSVPSTVDGNKTNDVAVPGSNNLGALVAVATTAAPTYHEGRLVALSTDLTGSLRVSATIDTSAIATSANQTNGNQTVKGTGTAGTPSTGVLTVQGITSMTPLLVTATAVGTIADDATTPGNPVMVGGQAKSPDGTSPGNVSAEDDVIRWIGDLNRIQYVKNIHPANAKKHLDGSTAYTDEEIVADPGAGLQTIITNIICSTGAATAMNFFLEEGSTKVFGPIYLEAVNGRGFCSGPIALPITAHTAVTLTSSASIAQSFDFEYFIQKV